MRYPDDYLLAESLARITDRTRWQHILDRLSYEQRDALGKAAEEEFVEFINK
jgi:hypothetical protein